MDACFRSPTFPAIRAGAANRSTCQNEKIPGITARTGPSGWQWIELRFTPVSTTSSARKPSAFSA
jgi:hypothetical protein